MEYGTPVIGVTNSDVGPQIRTDYYNKKALVEAAKEMYFGQLANVTAMPKNMGKKIKQFHYLPILDDRNQNEQGLDASEISWFWNDQEVTRSIDLEEADQAKELIKIHYLLPDVGGPTRYGGFAFLTYVQI